MFAVRVNPYKAAELINEGCAEGEIWVKDRDSIFYWSEAERGVWPTQEEAWKHATEPWEYVVAVSLPESKGAHEELRRLMELLPDNLSSSKDYNFSSSPSSRVEWLLGRLESNADEIKRLEEGMDRLLEVMAAEKQKRYDVKEPNFRDGKGNLAPR